jgi:predicted aldo/keto reductase-like oxidoreductase
MSRKNNEINRRNFLKTVGAAGLGSALVGAKTSLAAEETKAGAGKPSETQITQIPKRKLGRADIEVPCLALGTMFNVIDNQAILRKSLQWGVYYWDTAHNYNNGNSELGIGKFIEKNPEVREKLFLATKASGAGSPKQIEQRLKTSLERMNTSYIDLYYGVHGCSNPRQLTNYLRKWAEDAKERKAIRFFGFTTHKNMAKCLATAAKLDWIDAIMTSYNFRLMQDPEMQDAVEACHKAGIAVIAMKTQAMQIETDDDKKLTEHFQNKGFTAGQAKLKAVLDDKRITTACVGRDNIAHLTLNIAAALDKTSLTKADKDVFTEYAKQTCDGYCAGCAEICDEALAGTPYASEIMRYLMYYNNYGDCKEAKLLFAQIPGRIRRKLLSVDYSIAESRCPQHLPIGKLVAEAVKKLGQGSYQV